MAWADARHGQLVASAFLPACPLRWRILGSSMLCGARRRGRRMAVAETPISIQIPFGCCPQVALTRLAAAKPLQLLILGTGKHTAELWLHLCCMLATVPDFFGFARATPLFYSPSP